MIVATIHVAPQSLRIVVAFGMQPLLKAVEVALQIVCGASKFNG